MQGSDTAMKSTHAPFFCLSFPRRRESLLAFTVGTSKSDSRLRGNDGFWFSGFVQLALLVSLLLPTIALAQTSDPAPLQFRDTAEETRFHDLTTELRCVKCQNQSLADSNAQIAHDLRREVLQLMHEGRSDEDIKRYLVDRYGEFVLYRPQVEGRTWLLWFGPALLLLAGVLVLARILKQRGGAALPDDDGQEW